MCLILLAWQRHEHYPLVLAANRDEFYARPTLPAHFWSSAPELLGGQDQRRGGTWLGITRNGRLAMITNIRQPHSPAATASRGHLVRDWLTDSASAEELERWGKQRTGNFPPFNLIAGDLGRLGYLNNNQRELRETPLLPGIHGLSNALFDTPWPKVVRGRQGLKKLLQGPAADLEEGLFELLSDRQLAPEAELPDTGIDRDRERLLSAIFIASPDYGTRSSTVLLVDATGRVTFTERNHTPGDGRAIERRFSWVLPVGGPARTQPQPA